MLPREVRIARADCTICGSDEHMAVVQLHAEAEKVGRGGTLYVQGAGFFGCPDEPEGVIDFHGATIAFDTDGP